MGDGIDDAVEEGPDRCSGNPLQDRLVKPRAQGAERRPVRSGQREQGGVLTGRAQRDVSVQGREQPAAGADGFPPQRKHGRVLVDHQIPEMHLDQPGHTRSGPQRVDPDHANDPQAVGILRSIQQRALASKVRQPGLGSIKADIQ